MIGANHSVKNGNHIKIYSEYPEVAKQIERLKPNLAKVKPYVNFNDLREMWVEGSNKLMSEFESAKRINEKDRKVVIVEGTSIMSTLAQLGSEKEKDVESKMKAVSMNTSDNLSTS